MLNRVDCKKLTDTVRAFNLTVGDMDEIKAIDSGIKEQINRGDYHYTHYTTFNENIKMYLLSLGFSLKGKDESYQIVKWDW